MYSPENHAPNLMGGYVDLPLQLSLETINAKIAHPQIVFFHFTYERPFPFIHFIFFISSQKSSLKCDVFIIQFNIIYIMRNPL